LDFLPENIKAVSNKNSKRFHQDVSQMEKRYSGICSPNMLYDYCRVLKRQALNGEYKRQKKMK
jgi:hypothetical protein